MSSVQRFLKQVNPATALFNAPAANRATGMYKFVADTGNVVGNYPPGYMAALGSDVITAINALGATAVLRDMGKTIYAPVSSLTGSKGYFRQVQVLLPEAVATGSKFGVNGTTAGDYLVVYVPVPVAGVLASGVSLYNGDVLSASSM